MFTTVAERNDNPTILKGASIFVACFLGVVVVVLFFAFASTVGELIMKSGAGSWHVVDGVVVSSTSSRCRSGYSTHVRYRYSVGQREYLSRRIAFGMQHCGSQYDADRTLATYPEGKTVRVHYDPKSPEDSALDIAQTASGTWLFFVSLPLFLMFLMIGTFGCIHLWRTAQIAAARENALLESKESKGPGSII